MTRRFFWPSFALPGAVWLVLLFLVPTYAVARGRVRHRRPDLLEPGAGLEPAALAVRHDARASSTSCGRASRSGPSSCARSRTSASRSPAASRSATRSRTTSPGTRGRTKTLLLVLLIVPFWVSYLMRMLAWVGPAAPDGLVNRTLIDLGVLSHPYGWLDGQASSVILALIYGYVPYLILPLYATLDRIEPQRARGRPRSRREPDRARSCT